MYIHRYICTYIYIYIYVYTPRLGHCIIGKASKACCSPVTERAPVHVLCYPSHAMPYVNATRQALMQLYVIVCYGLVVVWFTFLWVALLCC